ncbi:MAG TPA: hypothetical protein VFO54_03515, partial [Chryseosolibacter sp.]|nr:hypothetical protein [Chryseosolibacter sp.]
MSISTYHIFLISLTISIVAPDNTAEDHPAASFSSPVADNPLVAEWTGPYGGVPPFDRIKVADFEPALEAGMKKHLEEIGKIASSREPA